MTALSPTAAAIARLLTEELREVEGFVALLKQEQALLTAAGNVDELMPVVEAKSGFATRLGGLFEQREKKLAEAGYPTGRAGMEALIATSPNSTAMAAQWQRLIAMAAEARNLNETNGKLVVLHLQHNQQALAALVSATDRAMTYGPDGQQHGSGGTGRSFGSV